MTVPAGPSGPKPPRTLPQALREAAASGEGYVFLDGRVERRRSYAEMYEASLHRAGQYRSMGLQRGDVVALAVADEEQFLTALFGASLAGLIPASLYPPATAAELSHVIEGTAAVLRSARARAIVTSPSHAGAMEALRGHCPDLAMVIGGEPFHGPAEAGHHVQHGGPDQPPLKLRRSAEALAKAEGGHHVPLSLDDVAFVQFTSGSTSRPKGVAITHRGLAANIDAINGPAGLASSSSDSAVSWLPLHHDMGLVGMALGAMYCGRPAVLMTPATFVKRPIEWLRAISRHRATVSFAPNFAYDLCVRRVKSSDLDGIDLSCWRVAGCGAEPIHAATLAAFAEKFGRVGFRETSFLPSYGLAEHVLAATFAPRGRALRIETLSGADLVSCGPPLPDHRIRIVSEDGRDLPERAVGEIALSGPSVMKEYYRDEQQTNEAIRDGWLFTGDLGYLADGELFVCGRSKDLVVVNGRKHHPEDLEWAVDELAGIRRGRVVAFGTSRAGLPDRVVIVAEPSGIVASDTLADAIRRRVSDAAGLYVDDVVLVPSGTIARTTSGKVQRSATKTRYEAGELGR